MIVGLEGSPNVSKCNLVPFTSKAGNDGSSATVFGTSTPGSEASRQPHNAQITINGKVLRCFKDAVFTTTRDPNSNINMGKLIAYMKMRGELQTEIF
jgi:hypothetical protein